MAKILSYLKEVTGNAKAAAAVTRGLLYGINSSGKVAAATNATGAYVAAAGFAVEPLTTAQVNNNDVEALSQIGMVEFDTANIAGGALTIGATVYLDTAGGVTTTSPTANGTLVQPVGIAFSATQVLLNIHAPSVKAQTAGNSNAGLL